MVVSHPASHSVRPSVRQSVGVDAGLPVSCSGRLVSPSGSHTVEPAEEPLRGKELRPSAGCVFGQFVKNVSKLFADFCGYVTGCRLDREEDTGLQM